ncbi:MAG: hypothetical protein ABI234_02695 [Ktedonobacteraceae bacterium]
MCQQTHLHTPGKALHVIRFKRNIGKWEHLKALSIQLQIIALILTKRHTYMPRAHFPD